VDLLEQALAGLVPGNAYIEIMQSASGKPLVLGQTGNAALKLGQPVTASIAGTRWILSYWGGPGSPAVGAAETATGPGLMYTGLGGAAVIVCIAIIVMLKRGRSAAADGPAQVQPEIIYAGAIRAIMDGAHPGMEKLISNLPERTPTTDRKFIPGISEGMDGADITRIMTKDKLKAAVAAGDVLDLTAAPAAEDQKAGDKKESNPAVTVSEVIFRKYDIRGVVKDNLTPQVVEKIGQAIGAAAEEARQKTIVVGRDGRLSSPELAGSLIKGLQAAGRDVIDIGVVPTPVLYFATHHLKARSGVMVTGSHNGPEYNGLKIVLGGNTLSEDGITGLYQRITKGQLHTGTGSLNTAEILTDYIRRITDDVPVALGNSYKLVVDCGNGVAGVAAPQLYRALGHDVIELYCELDGRFPNHHPDPSQPKNLQALIDRVKQENADLGFAFDGDGDRLGVVDGNGNIIWPDRQMIVFARDVLSRNQGAPIIFDVKCSSHLKKTIEASGGKALMWKTGHSLIKGKMKETEAPLAGEMSGHIFFKERWYGFDDALYAGARLLEILVKSKAKPAEVFAKIPDSVSTPELKVDLPEKLHQPFMKKLESKLSFDGAEVITVDGFRVEFKDGWGLIRPSNTTPCLVARFEADNPSALARIQGAFKELLLSIKPDLQIPF
jgi:phosphomannomutase/phosphoglucomutase